MWRGSDILWQLMHFRDPVMTRAQDRILVQEHLAHLAEPKPLSASEKADLEARIKAALKAKDAVLVAHYYTDPDIQRLAEETGGCVADSLEMARFGNQHPASTVVVAGVRFMGETAKILNPEKRVLMPTLEATCSLDVGCPADEFSEFCDQHPDRTVVVYANTSAAVKARADWVVTSSCAQAIVEHLDARGEKILWAPDKHLGHYVQKTTGADVLLWDGSCIVHEEFNFRGMEDRKALYPDAAVHRALRSSRPRNLNSSCTMQEPSHSSTSADLKALYPDAAVLVHPESPDAVVQMA